MAQKKKAIENKLISAFLLKIVFYSVLGILLLQMNPFNINERSDAAYQDAFYRLVAPYYSHQAQDDIALVMVNDQAIEYLYDSGQFVANEWPIQYGDHSVVLNKILSYKPKAVFVDIYFKKQRSTDPTFDHLARTVNRANRRDIPLLFAGGFADEVFTGIQQKLNKNGGLSINGWQGFSGYYPLSVGDKTTAAFDLYRIACLGSNPLSSCAGNRLDDRQLVEDQALSVNWGSIGSKPAVLNRSGECNSSGYGIWEMLMAGLLKGFIDDSNITSKPLCDYHKLIYADELISIAKNRCHEGDLAEKQSCSHQKQVLKDALENKVVLYGIHLEGLHDLVTSPVHGQLPGAFFHSMALDNLISQGGNATKASDDTMWLITNFTWMGVVIAVLLGSQIRPAGIASTSQDSWRSFAGIRRRIQLYIFGAIPLAFGTYISFFILHYEPVNALTFVSMVMLMVELIRQEFAVRMLEGIIKIYRWIEGYLSTWLCDFKNINNKE